VNGLIGALWFWSRINANKIADKDKLDSISDLINIGRETAAYGDANGFTHRKELLEKNKQIFGA